MERALFLPCYSQRVIDHRSDQGSRTRSWEGTHHTSDVNAGNTPEVLNLPAAVTPTIKEFSCYFITDFSIVVSYNIQDIRYVTPWHLLPTWYFWEEKKIKKIDISHASNFHFCEPSFHSLGLEKKRLEPRESWIESSMLVKSRRKAQLPGCIN